MNDERYDYRACVVSSPDHPPPATVLAEAEAALIRAHGAGWEFEGSVPAAVLSPDSPRESSYRLVLIFRRRKAHQVTGVSVGPA